MNQENELLYLILSNNKVEAINYLEKLVAFCEEEHKIEYEIIQIMDIIGEGWEEGIYSLAQIYMSSALIESMMMYFHSKEQMMTRHSEKIGICTFIDYHGLGKTIVKSILTGQGYDVIDFGEGVSPQTLKHILQTEDLDYLLISTLMLGSALAIEDISKWAKAHEIKTRLIVGGAPFRLNPELTNKVDVYASASHANEILKILV